ncbi:MAG TPA: energy-coupling factor ABC transporter permease [Acidimicrobiia bacterium]
MHIPDGFINGTTSTAAGVVAAGGVGVAIRQTGRYMTERQVPLAGLVAAFVFAAQMFNFPVLPGMSGHLLGGVLAAVLVGPWAGLLIITVVLMVQAVFFADGGLSALGLSVVNMGLIGTLVGYLIYRAILRVAPRSATGVTVSAGIAAFLSVPLAAMGFVVEYAIGGTAPASVGAVFTAMVGTHLLIGIGEGILTALVIGAVMTARPDLVYGNPSYQGDRTEVLV